MKLKIAKLENSLKEFRASISNVHKNPLHQDINTNDPFMTSLNKAIHVSLNKVLNLENEMLWKMFGNSKRGL